MEILDHDTLLEMYAEFKKDYEEEEGDTCDKTFDQYLEYQMDMDNIIWDDYHDRYLWNSTQ